VQLRQNDAAMAKSSSLSKSKPAKSATQSSNSVSCCAYETNCAAALGSSKVMLSGWICCGTANSTGSRNFQGRCSRNS